MVTPKTIGIYLYIVAKGAPTSSGALAEALGGDRKTYLKDLKALRDHGLLSTRVEVINGRPITVNALTDESPLNGLQILLSQLNTNINNITYSFISKKEYIRERMEGPMRDEEYEEVPMYLEPEEKAEYIRRARQKRDAVYREMKAAEALERIKAKSEKTPDMWSSDDSAYHFAERMSLMWHVLPWKTARVRFKAAFGKARKIHGTTGDIELKMMDRFFETLEHNKHINDPDVIWKSFIKQFGALQIDVLNTTVTVEDKAAAKEVADKQWGDLGV